MAIKKIFSLIYNACIVVIIKDRLVFYHAHYLFQIVWEYTNTAFPPVFNKSGPKDIGIPFLSKSNIHITFIL